MREIDLISEAEKIVINRQRQLEGEAQEDPPEEEIHNVDILQLDKLINAHFNRVGPTIQEAVDSASINLERFERTKRPSLENFNLHKGSLVNRLAELNSNDLPYPDELYLYWAISELDPAFLPHNKDKRSQALELLDKSLPVLDWGCKQPVDDQGMLARKSAEAVGRLVTFGTPEQQLKGRLVLQRNIRAITLSAQRNTPWVHEYRASLRLLGLESKI